MKIHSEEVTLYALREPHGKRRIRYVGQTVTLRSRTTFHKYWKGVNLEMHALRRASVTDASRLELQIMAACKRKGMADLNKNRARFMRPPRIFNPSLCIENGFVFISSGHASRFFKCSRELIYQALDKGRSIAGCTLQRVSKSLVLDLLKNNSK